MLSLFSQKSQKPVPPTVSDKKVQVPTRLPPLIPRPVGRKRKQTPKSIKLSSDRMHAIVRSLHISSDLKEPEESDGAAGGLAASLVDPRAEYTFRLVNSGSITAGSGIWAGAVKFDPTAVAEWSSFDALFNEYKVVSAKITFLPLFPVPTASGTYQSPFVILAVNMGSFGTNPTSVANCMEPANSKVVYLTPGGPHDQYLMSTKITGLAWLNIGGTQTPYAGAYGQFSVYGSDWQSSSLVLNYVLELGVSMRARS